MQLKKLILSATILIGAASFCLMACSKDKYTTKPQLKFIKAQNYEVAYGELLEMEIEFTDKEGDLSDSIFIQKVVPKCTNSNITQGYPMPKFTATSNLKGTMNITYVNGKFISGYASLGAPLCGRNDTATFKFWIRDKAKNVSDTITSDKSIILKIP